MKTITLPRTLLLLCLASLGMTFGAVAGATDSQRLPLGKGTLSAPKTAWTAIGVPPGSIVIEYDKFDTYGKSFSALPARGLDATGFRPKSLPSRHALLAGATGTAVRKVKLHLRGGTVKTLKTVAPPGSWSSRNRLFAYGWTVPARHAKAMVQVLKIEALDSRGKTISTLKKVSTAAY